MFRLNIKMVMSIRWKNIVLLLCCASIFNFSCKKQFSSDAPLPTSYSPSIIISSDNQVVYALNPQTGAKNWQLSLPPLNGLLPTDFAPSPMMYNGVLYLTSINSDTIYKVNANTGTVIKRMTVSGTNSAAYFTVIATPVASGGLIFLATTNDTLYAIDTTGVTHWKFGADGPLESSPVVYNGYVYIASTTGHVFCISTSGPGTSSSGSVGTNPNSPVWEYPSSDIIPNILNGYTSNVSFVSSPTICPPYLYIGSTADSNMYCIYLTPPAPTTASTGLGVTVGVARWVFKTSGGIYSSPDALDGRVIFGSNDFQVYCLDSTPQYISGQPHVIWHDSTHDEVYSSPFVSNQMVYVASRDYRLYALNIINGQSKWSFKSNGLIKSSPLVYGGMVYIGSYDKNIYALDSATGTLKWQFNTNGNIECSPVVNDLTGNNYNASQISGFMRQPND